MDEWLNDYSLEDEYFESPEYAGTADDIAKESYKLDRVRVKRLKLEVIE